MELSSDINVTDSSTESVCADACVTGVSKRAVIRGQLAKKKRRPQVPVGFFEVRQAVAHKSSHKARVLTPGSSS